MKILPTCLGLAAFVAVTISSLAQTSSVVGYPKGTMPVYVDVNLGGGDGATYQTTKQPGRIAGEVTVWATSTGRIEYTFAADAIQYSDPAIAQSLGIDVIYEAIARETVIQGIARGYHPLTTSVATTKVYDPNSVAHEYRISYSQTTSAPVITEISEKVLAPQSTIQ